MGVGIRTPGSANPLELLPRCCCRPTESPRPANCSSKRAGAGRPCSRSPATARSKRTPGFTVSGNEAITERAPAYLQRTSDRSMLSSRYNDRRYVERFAASTSRVRTRSNRLPPWHKSAATMSVNGTNTDSSEAANRITQHASPYSFFNAITRSGAVRSGSLDVESARPSAWDRARLPKWSPPRNWPRQRPAGSSSAMAAVKHAELKTSILARASYDLFGIAEPR